MPRQIVPSTEIYLNLYEIYQQDLSKVNVLKQCAAPFGEHPVYNLPSAEIRQKCNV